MLQTEPGRLYQPTGMAQPVFEILGEMHVKPKLRFLCSQMVIQIASAIENNFDMLNLPTDAIVFGDQEHRRRRDPAVRRALALQVMQKGWAKNGRRFGKSVGATGKKFGAIKSDLRQSVMATYFWQSCKAFAGSVQVGRCGDAASIGKKRLASAVMNLQSGIAAWTLPKARFLLGTQ